jgi:hypothetical protein
MENYILPKNSRMIKIANLTKNKKISELLQIRDQMINNNIKEQDIKKFTDEQYEKINDEYIKNINKKIDIKKEINKKRNNAVQFLLKNKNFLEQNKAPPEYIKQYVRKQYEDINKRYLLKNVDDGINFID